MRYIIILLVLIMLSGCYNKIVLITVDQEASQTNTLGLSENVLDTEDKFEGDSQPVIEVPLIP